MSKYMMRIRKAGISLSFALAAAFCTSCSSDFLDEYSQDLSRVNNVDDLQEVLVGDCYLPLAVIKYESSYFEFENYNYILIHMMADELEENLMTHDEDPDPSTREKYFPYFCWQKDCFLNYEGKNYFEGDEEEPWTLSYKLINSCNMVLAKADELSVNNDDDMQQLNRIKGEAYFLRAAYYYMLVNLYAKPYTQATAESTPGVPVKTNEKVEDKEFTRASVAEVYRQIISDMDNAEKFLADVTAPASIYHAGINAVYLLRSRICLYMQDWDGACRYAQMSLEQNRTLCNLETLSTSDYPMSDSNPEIFYSNGSSCFGNICFREPNSEGWYGWEEPTYVVSEHLLNLYADNDLRLGRYITNDDDRENGQYTYHKIDNSVNSYNIYKKVSDILCLRSAEAYLNLAEAKAQLGEEAEACAALNTLRRARIDGDYEVSLSGSELVTFIREERERELCYEGHRWFDLRRYMVDAKYPFTKSIEHSFSNYKNYALSSAVFYRLEPNDEAYTLNIPKSVRDFQISIGSNERPARPVVRTESY